jgi:hypothetical protein
MQMIRHGSLVLLALLAIAISRTGHAEETPRVIGPDEGTKITSGAITFRLPFTLPNKARILAAAPKTKANLEPKTVDCELVSYRVEPEKFYPLVGAARLSQARFKCKVTWKGQAAAQDVYFLEHEQLILCPSDSKK